ncbi:MAG: hypothetical protein P4L74_03100 [Candidatus Doudnabacteria bacterium]|nr:hypothetical protein [Candidatus Doudnabacteria bacterium]
MPIPVLDDLSAAQRMAVGCVMWSLVVLLVVYSLFLVRSRPDESRDHSRKGRKE